MNLLPKHRDWLLLIILACLTFPPRLIGLDQFLGPDEIAQWGRANKFMLALLNGDWSGTHLRDDTGNLTLMWLQAGATGLRYGYHWLQGSAVSVSDLIALDRPLDMLAEVRFPLAVVNGLLVLLTFHWLKRLWGWQAAFIAGALLALDPFLLSESRMLRSEAIYTTLMGLSIVTLLLYLQGYRRALWLSGIFGGLAVSSKISGLFLVGFGPLILVGYLVIYARSQTEPVSKLALRLPVILKQGASALAIWSFGYLMTAILLWPALWVRPLAIIASIQRTAEFAGLEGKTDERFFLGQLWENLPTYYYLLALPFRTTPLVWLGLLAVVVGGGYWLIRQIAGKTKVGRDGFSPLRPAEAETTNNNAEAEVRSDGFSRPRPAEAGTTNNRSPDWQSVLILLLFALLYTLVFSLAANKTDRYILTTIWSLDILAGFGLVWLGNQLAGRLTGQPLAESTGLFTLGALLVISWQAYLVAQVHPYYTAYYNPLLGGQPQAAKIFQLGYGEGVQQIANYLNAQPQAEDLTLVCGTNAPRCQIFFDGETWQSRTLNPVNGRWVLADYVLLYITQRQRDLYPPGIVPYLERQPASYVATINGVEYASLYPAPRAARYGEAARLTGLGTLLGYTFKPATEVRAGESFAITVYWHNEGQPAKTLSAQLVSPAGYTWVETTLTPRPGFETATQIEDSIVESTGQLTVPLGLTPGNHLVRFGFRLTKEPQTFLPFKVSPPQNQILIAPAPLDPADIPVHHQLDQSVSPNLKLVGHNLTDEARKPGQVMWLPLVWQAADTITTDYVILIRLLDAAGKEAAYWLGRPVQSSQPTNQWQAGQVVQDPWHLNLPDTMTAGDYHFEIALFDADTQAEINRFPLPATIQVITAEEMSRNEVNPHD